MADNKVEQKHARITPNSQINYLVKCMECFPSLAMPSIRTKERRELINQKWHKVSVDINRIKRGTVKTGPEWQRYWKLYKHQVRKKYYRIKSGENLKLNQYEGRVLKILCDDEGELKNIDGLIDPNAEFNPDIEDDLLQPVPDMELEDEDSTNSIYDDVEDVPDVKREEDFVQPMVAQEERVASENARAENVWITENYKEEVQTKLLQSHLERQKEMHILQMAQKKERHKKEMEIFELKKKHAMHEFYRVRMMACDTSSESDSVRETENFLSLTPMVTSQAKDGGGIESRITEEQTNDSEKTKEEIKVEILQFTLKRQREMHALETEQVKERHKIEIEILQLKKQKTLLELERIRS